MSRSRRVFSKEFKAKVVLEALKENNTIEVLAKKYELLTHKICTLQMYLKMMMTIY